MKAERRTKLQLLTAPVDGVVQQLAVHTIGGVVTSAQALVVVVPLESRLEIEPWCRTMMWDLCMPGKMRRSK